MLVLGNGDDDLPTPRVARVPPLIGLKLPNQRRVIGHSLNRKAKPALGITTVGLGRQNPGSSVGGAALISAVDQQCPRATTHQVIGGRHPYHSPSDDDGEELAISKLGLPQRLGESLEKRGITHLFPIQVQSLILSI